MYCSKSVSGWRQARRPAKEKYRPLREKLRPVKTVLAGSALQQGEVQGHTSVEVLFDSFSQWRFEGLRSAGKRMRQLLYRAGCYQVDIQIEASEQTNRILITGQLLDTDCPDMIGRNVQVSISNGGKFVHLVTNEFGEFHGELEDHDHLELSFRSRAGKTIAVSLPHPLQ